jgi:hypothetical protein
MHVVPDGAGRGKAAIPSIQIHLDNHYNSKVYTSGSYVSGHVAVEPPRDIAFDSFEISFTGIVATRLDFVQSYTTNAIRTFLKLRMPIPESIIPSSRVFQAGQKVKVPFHFVVPHQLTIGACNHGCDTPDLVKDQHLRLPPTMGYWDADDQAPDMTHIEYAIRAKAVRGSSSGNQRAPVMEGKKVIKVLAATPEDPPLDITPKDERYCMSKTKTLRKNLLSTKMGELKVSSSEPGSVILSGDGAGASSTCAHVNLEFAPATAEQLPPKINSVQGKIITTTFFGSTPQDNLPNLGSKDNYATNGLLTYSGNHNLFNSRLDKVTWTEEHLPMPRRDSGYSTLGTPGEECPGSDEDGGYFAQGGPKSKSKKSQGPPIRHRAQLEIPVKIPVSNKRIFLPTFHSCLISRTYILQLTISVGLTNTTFTLNVPLQLGVEQRFEPEGDALPSFENALAEAEAQAADSYWQPRAVQRPLPSTRQHSILPGYNEISGQFVPVA